MTSDSLPSLSDKGVEGKYFGIATYELRAPDHISISRKHIKGVDGRLAPGAESG